MEKSQTYQVRVKNTRYDLRLELSDYKSSNCKVIAVILIHRLWNISKELPRSLINAYTQKNSPSESEKNSPEIPGKHLI